MAGLEISEAGVLICKDYSGRPSGEAYVEILNEEHLEAAVEKHNENMGHRWGLVVLQFLVSHPAHTSNQTQAALAHIDVRVNVNVIIEGTLRCSNLITRRR